MVQNSSVSHAIALVPQPTPQTCWAASTAMLTGIPVSIVRSTTPADLLSSNGGLKNYSSVSDWETGTKKYAAVHNLAYAAPQSWSVDALHDQLAHGPMMFDMLWNTQNYTSQAGSSGHVICITGMSGEGGNTTLTYNDPWPPGVGAVTTVNYATWMQNVPTRTYRVFWNA